jgi:hypothetical protein
LVYIEPESATPAAICVDATRATWRDKQVHLDHGVVVRSSVMFGRGGEWLPAERPRQIFTRWYGFALTFPGCEVFGQ